MKLRGAICSLALFLASANMADAAGHFDRIPPAQTAPAATPSISGADADSLIKSLVSVFNGVSDELALITRSIILIFFAINLIVTLGRSIIGDAPFAEFLQKLGFNIMMAVFLLGIITIIPDVITWLLQFSGTLNQAAVNGAGLSAANTGTPAEPSVGNILQAGLSGLAAMWDEVSLLSPATLLLIFVALAAAVLLGVTIAVFIVAYGELYFVAVLGMIVLGLGVFEPTKDLVKTYFMTLLGSALGLTTILLTYAIITGASSAAFGSASGWDGGTTEVLAALLLQVVGVFLILMLPRTIQGLVGGTGSSALGPMLGALVAGGIAKAGAAALGAVSGGAGGAVSGAMNASGGGIGNALGSAAKGALDGAKKYGSAGWSRPVTGLGRQAASDLRTKFGTSKND